MEDFENNQKHRVLIQAMGIFENMIDGHCHEESEQKDTDAQREYATSLYQLMKNELEKSDSDYFGEVFHRICEERVFYAITPFQKYVDKHYTADLDISSLTLAEFKCTKCDKVMLDVSRTHLEVEKCHQCETEWNQSPP